MTFLCLPQVSATCARTPSPVGMTPAFSLTLPLTSGGPPFHMMLAHSVSALSFRRMVPFEFQTPCTVVMVASPLLVPRVRSGSCFIALAGALEGPHQGGGKRPLGQVAHPIFLGLV